MADVKKKFGEIIGFNRTKLRMSQEMLAGTFISVRHLQRIESGENLPSIAIVSYLCSQLKLDLSEVLLKLLFVDDDIDFNIDILIIHRINIDDKILRYLSDNIEAILQSEFLEYNLKIGILYLCLYFKITVDEEIICNEAEFILNKGKYSELEAEFIAAIIKRKSSHKIIFRIQDNIEEILSSKGSIYPIIYGICIQWYEQNNWEKIIWICTELISSREMFYNDSKYLPHIYAQLGVAEYKKYKIITDNFKTAVKLSNIFKNKQLVSLLNEVID